MKFEPWMLAALDEAGYNDSCSTSEKRVPSKTEVPGNIKLDKLTCEDIFNGDRNISDRLTEEDLDRLKEELSKYLSL